MRGTLLLCLIVVQPIASQQIWDIVSLTSSRCIIVVDLSLSLTKQWQTTWDRSKLFTPLAPSTPVNFVTPGPAASADIVVTDSTKFQTIVGGYRTRRRSL